MGQEKSALTAIKHAKMWKIILYLALIFAVARIVFSFFEGEFSTEFLTENAGRIFGAFVVILLLKYAPWFSYEKEKERLTGLTDSIVKKVYWMILIGYILFVLTFVLMILLPSYSVMLFVGVIILSNILINSAIFYFWYKTKSKLFVIIGGIAALFFLILFLGQFIVKSMQEAGAIMVSVAAAILLFGFWIGGLVYSIYILFKYISPNVKPYGSNKSWTELHKEKKEGD
ncbi:MAG: hypothetical protein ABH986_05025 [archaeon]